MDRNYTYSYSGADCKAYAYFDSNESNLVQLDSLATISISVYEAKAPVRRLGHRGVSGFTKGIRTIAGSMVFLVIEDHPLWKLLSQNKFENSYSLDDNEKEKRSLTRVSKRKLSSMLEPFNILLFFQTEVTEIKNSGRTIDFISEGRASMLLENIEIISEGIVSSVNDMVTEIQMQFIAKDFSAIDKEIIKDEISEKEISEKEIKEGWADFVENLKPYVEKGVVTLSELDSLLKEEQAKKVKTQSKTKEESDIIINEKGPWRSRVFNK